MIFVTLGSQKFQFNRLLKEIDRLVEERIIKEDIFAQIGYSDYKPKNYSYKNFLDRDEFKEKMTKCDIVITHGGTGAIIGAVKEAKKVIAVPRLEKYGEHVDNHQLEIVSRFDEMELIKSIEKEGELQDALTTICEIKFKSYISNTQKIINYIEAYIDGL